MAKNVLILTGDMAEALEVLYPLHRLKEEGYTVDIAAPTQKLIQTVVHDFEPGIDTFTEKYGYRVQADFAFSEIDPSRYDGAVIPGGRAPEHIRNDSAFIPLVNHFVETRKPLAFECHAALALLPLGHLKGRRCAAFWSLKPDLIAAGATFVDEEVVVDGNFVTSRAWIDHPGYMREFIRLLRG
ncbi:DJ-1/PfpI family protein [Paenibacillus validus]|uniref:DJ-1/PfpI/YhbO family deglycase/protease n=1 Tax=Paenibacillus validus TaxID=44253 RepID=A0A7X2ZB49_9BACL|nr:MULTISPECIES: DJ-1/PfpI family protein [Paenibacillus]MED4602356.1 DJ-1/PfpI family protein [Paenibacillus validus]MED4608290.1 DJ-1/PfpI family protein [Paenibacillus validus]MUG71658.1 DJ-1/PfpI/YhbO family deglycase/protease [Paenibacillus validus]